MIIGYPVFTQSTVTLCSQWPGSQRWKEPAEFSVIVFSKGINKRVQLRAAHPYSQMLTSAAHNGKVSTLYVLDMIFTHYFLHVSMLTFVNLVYSRSLIRTATNIYFNHPLIDESFIL